MADRQNKMQNIVIAKPYRFVPPRFSPFWARIIEWYLPTFLRKNFGITSWQCLGAERLVASLKAGDGVLLASNHCRPCDPMVLGYMAYRIRCYPHIMASWHLFMQGGLTSWLLPRMGVFSVYREGLDRAHQRERRQHGSHKATQRYAVLLGQHEGHLVGDPDSGSGGS